MTTVLLDTHVVHWWSAHPDLLSADATSALTEAGELVVAAVTWWELAWVAEHRRIVITSPVRAWLEELAAQVLTLPLTPAIAATAAALPPSFPSDPADRQIFATAIEHGLPLVTKDRTLRSHGHPGVTTVW